MSYDAYHRVANTPPHGNDPVKVEAWALTQAANAMVTAQRSADRAQVQDAARLNWKLWTIFQAELSAVDSTVPDKVRADMLSLCNFVDQHTVAILHKGMPDQLTVLININRNIAEGQLDGVLSESNIEAKNIAEKIDIDHDAERKSGVVKISV